MSGQQNNLTRRLQKRSRLMFWTIASIGYGRQARRRRRLSATAFVTGWQVGRLNPKSWALIALWSPDQVAIGDPVVNGKLSLQYGEPDFDRKLAANPNYQQLNIQGIPEGVKVKHFVDAKGYFFWLDGSGEMEQIRGGDGTNFTAPTKTLLFDSSQRNPDEHHSADDLEATRLKVNEALAAEGGFKGFSFLDVLDRLAELRRRRAE